AVGNSLGINGPELRRTDLSLAREPRRCRSVPLHLGSGATALLRRPNFRSLSLPDPVDGIRACRSQGLRITIAILGHMGSFVSRANPDFCPTVLRLFDSVVTNTGNCYSRHII